MTEDTIEIVSKAIVLLTAVPARGLGRIFKFSEGLAEEGLDEWP